MSYARYTRITYVTSAAYAMPSSAPKNVCSTSDTLCGNSLNSRRTDSAGNGVSDETLRRSTASICARRSASDGILACSRISRALSATGAAA